MSGLLGLFVIATLGRALVGGVTLLDVNLLTRFAPWQALHGQDVLNTNICRGDTVDSVMPSIAEIRSRLAHGDFPGWSASAVGGFPLGGVPNFGQFSLLALPYYGLPLWLAPAFVKLGEFAVAIAGMTLFLRRLRLSYAAGVLAGIIFATSGFMISWTNWPQTRVAAFIPALFWVTERLVQRQRAVDVLPLAVVVASMLLGGFPAVTGMALYCAALYFLVRLVMVHGSRWKDSARTVAFAVLGLGLGAGLSAFQLLPFSRQLSNINLDYRAQTAMDHSPLSSLLTTMVPNAQGLCINGDRYSPVNPIENVAFIGVAAMVLALVAILMRARMVERTQRGVVGFLGGAVVLVVTLGWVGGPVLSFAQRFPVFSTNDVARIRSLLGFLLAALAGFGFEWLLSVVRHRDDTPDEPPRRVGGPDDEPAGGPAEAAEAVDGPALSLGSSPAGSARSRLRWSVVVLAATTFFALWVLIDAVAEARAGSGMGHLASAIAIPAMLLLICLAAVFAACSGRRWIRRAAIVAIALLVVGQSTSAFRGSVTGSKPASFYPVTSTHEFLQRNLGSARFASNGRTMYPATSAYYGLRTPTGHQFTTDPWKSLLLAVDPNAMWSPTFSWFTPGVVNARTAGDIPILDQMAVRYFVAAPSDIAGRSIRPPTSLRTATLTAGQHAKCQLTGGPLRAVTVNVVEPLHGAGPAGVTVHLVLHTPLGDLTGDRYFGADLKSTRTLAALKNIPVALPGEHLSPADPVTAEVWVSGVNGTFALRGSRAALSCGKVVPIRDGLKLVSSTGGTIIYERLTSQPRIRWASTMAVLSDPVARVARLRAGISADAVILHAPAPVPTGRPATVRVTADGGDTISAAVDAAGSGYLVVADSLQQPGWAATVDGKPVPLLPADHAMVAVPVSAGVHRVELTYTVPGQRAGALVTAGAFMLCLGIVALWWRRRPDRGEAPAQR